MGNRSKRGSRAKSKHAQVRRAILLGEGDARRFRAKMAARDAALAAGDTRKATMIASELSAEFDKGGLDVGEPEES